MAPICEMVYVLSKVRTVNGLQAPTAAVGIGRGVQRVLKQRWATLRTDVPHIELTAFRPTRTWQ